MSNPALVTAGWIVRHSRHLIATRGHGTCDLTAFAARALAESGVIEGTLTAFVRHTSCSLVLMENADPGHVRSSTSSSSASSPKKPRGSHIPAKGGSICPATSAWQRTGSLLRT